MNMLAGLPFGTVGYRPSDATFHATILPLPKQLDCGICGQPLDIDVMSNGTEFTCIHCDLWVFLHVWEVIHNAPPKRRSSSETASPEVSG